MSSYGPPAGPGVRPPFAAPPTDGDRARLWIGLSVGAALLVLCCGGGVAGIVGLTVTATEAVNEQAKVTVGDYLDAVRAQRYDDAYDLLCDRVQRTESLDEFADRVSDEPRVSDYQVYDAKGIGNNTDLEVPADVRFSGGQQRSLRFRLVQDRGTGTYEVCEIR